MNLLLFLITIFVSFIVVRIGAIAFELTGLEPSLARFQSLSCFTRTGFTTKEAELVTGHPQRRRIATTLIIIGNAGFVTLIGTFANSLRSDSFILKSQIPFLKVNIPSPMIPWFNFFVILCGIYIIYKIFSYARFADMFTNFVRKNIVRKEIIKKVTFEELMLSTGGYGVAQIEICENSPILNKRILETELRKHDISILVVERDNKNIPNPPADTTIILGDKLTCFGKLDDIREKICVMPQ